MRACIRFEIVCPKTQGNCSQKKELLTGALPRVVLRIICTKMKCLPSCLIYNLLAWGTGALFPARTTRVTRVSTANSFQRAKACQTRLEILPSWVRRSITFEFTRTSSSFCHTFHFYWPYISDDYQSRCCLWFLCQSAKFRKMEIRVRK